MPSPLRATSARIDVPGRSLFILTSMIAVVLATLAIAGCMPLTARQAGADPADPAATTAAVGYRSTLTPYSALRPATPASWRECDEGITPQPKPGRQQP